MNMNKKVLISAIAIAFFTAQSPVLAAFGHSSSKSSYSRSSRSSYSHYSAGTGTYQASRNNTSISGGNSIGMSRTNVTQSVRNGSYKQTIPANNTTVAGNNSGNRGTSNISNTGSTGYTNNNYQPSYNTSYNPYNNGSPTVNRTGHSTGALIGAAAVGGLIGYMLHRDSNGNVYYTNPSQPNVAYGANGQQLNQVPSGNYQPVGVVGNDGNVTQANNMATPTSSNSSNWFWFFLLSLLAIGATIYFFTRTKKNKEHSFMNFTPFKNPEEKIRDEKEQFFIDFQNNNRPSKIDFIQSKSDPVFFEAVKDLVMQSDETKKISIKRLEAELVDLTQDGTTYIASVRYQAILDEDGASTEIDEVWHFKYLNNDWKLAGIEQVAEQFV